MTFTQFQAECISMFGSHTKLPKINLPCIVLAHLQHQHSKRSTPEKKRSKEQTELIQQQEKETENLRTTQATGVSLQKLVSAVSQAMVCLCVGNKKTISDNKDTGGKKFVGTSRLLKPAMGIDGSLDINLAYQFCKDTGHELENCKWLQHKLAHVCMTTQGVVTEELLNPSHH